MFVWGALESTPLICRYLINYTPADIVYKLLSFKLFKLIISAMKEVHRVYGIHAGVEMAYKKYPTQYLLQAVAGILKGSMLISTSAC